MEQEEAKKQTYYPLHKDLFEEFIKFCEKSGGFEIW